MLKWGRDSVISLTSVRHAAAFLLHLLLHLLQLLTDLKHTEKHRKLKLTVPKCIIGAFK